MARFAVRSGLGVAGDHLERPRQAERVARELHAGGVREVLALARDGELHRVGGERRQDREHDGDEHEDGAAVAAGLAAPPAPPPKPLKKLQRRKKSAMRAIMPTRMPTSVAKRMS